MTDGILLAEIQRDPTLRRYDTIIVDEAHERTLNIDFLLGYLHRLLPQRPDLHLVITSATLDVERVAPTSAARRSSRSRPRLSGGDAVPAVRRRSRATNRDQVQAVCDAVEELAAEGPGDVLVFLSGEREIHDAADAVRALDIRRLEVLPLYARLSSAEQHRVFRPTPGAAWCSAPTSPRRRSPCPVCATWWTRARPESRATAIGCMCNDCRSSRWPSHRRTSAPAAAARRSGRVHPPLRGGGLRRPAGIHRARDPAHQPRLGHPPDGGARARRRRRVPVPRSTRRKVGPRRDGVAGRARRARRTGGSTSVGRRLAQLPIDPRFGRMVLEADRLDCVARGAGDRVSAVDPGRPRDAGGAARAGGGDASSLPARRQRLPRHRRAVGPPARSSSGPCPATSSAGCAAPSSSTTCGCASGKTCTASSVRPPAASASSRARRRPIRITCTRPCCPGCCRTSACASARHASSAAPAGRGSCSCPARRWRRSRRVGSSPPSWSKRRGCGVALPPPCNPSGRNSSASTSSNARTASPSGIPCEAA